MKHCGTQTIETERLILRQFKSEDADAMFKNWANDEEVTKYLTWSPHGTVDVTKEILKQWVDSYKDEKYYQWAIVLKEIDEPIGSISAVGMKESINMIHIGYCIGKKYRGREQKHGQWPEKRIRESGAGQDQRLRRIRR